MFVVVVEGTVTYVGSWTGASSFGKLCAMAGDSPVVRKARLGEPAAYAIAFREDRSLPVASA